MKKHMATFVALIAALNLYSQKSDTLKAKTLDSVTITSYLREPTIKGLSDIQGTYNFSGKKNEVFKSR